MTAAVVKPMAAMARLGYQVDVVCADSFCTELPLDDSLTSFAEAAFCKIHRLNPPKGLIGMLQRRFRVLRSVPDLMTVLHRPAYECLMDLDLAQYSAIMTWSPFHSINSVMVRVKRQRPKVPWIAQFSDPWSGNPLEINRLTKLWNLSHEHAAVAAADHIVHSSAYSLDLMLSGRSAALWKKASVLPHVFDERLYPQRPKAGNERLVLRYVGVLYGRRSPESLFLALSRLYKRRPELKDALTVELIGYVPPEMLATEAAKALPAGSIVHVPQLNYAESLARMYDADILLLIDADVQRNLFLPSKLSDYLGANTPIVGLVPPGASEDALAQLGCWYSRPNDVAALSAALEGAVDHVRERPTAAWCDESARQAFSAHRVAQRFDEIIHGLTRNG